MAWRSALGSNLKELRFVFCPHSAGSEGVRSYLRKSYSELKALNPAFPMLVRPSSGVHAYVLARYNQGIERKVYVEAMDEALVEKSLSKLSSERLTEVPEVGFSI